MTTPQLQWEAKHGEKPQKDWATLAQAVFLTIDSNIDAFQFGGLTVCATELCAQFEAFPFRSISTMRYHAEPNIPQTPSPYKKKIEIFEPLRKKEYDRNLKMDGTQSKQLHPRQAPFQCPNELDELYDHFSNHRPLPLTPPVLTFPFSRICRRLRLRPVEQVHDRHQRFTPRT